MSDPTPADLVRKAEQVWLDMNGKGEFEQMDIIAAALVAERERGRREGYEDGVKFGLAQGMKS